MTFSLFSVKVRIEYAFFLVICFSLLTGNGNIPILLLCSSLHEAGHLLSLLLLGGRAKAITLSYYGIGLTHSSNLSVPRELVFLISGITVNLLLFLLGVFPRINLALAVINALPLYPLDGGRILRLLLDSVFTLRISEKIMIIITTAILVFLIVLAIIFKNISLLLISMYIIFYSINYRGIYD